MEPPYCGKENGLLDLAISKAWLSDVIASFWWASGAGRVLDVWLLLVVKYWIAWIIRSQKREVRSCIAIKRAYSTESVSSSRRPKGDSSQSEVQSHFRNCAHDSWSIIYGFPLYLSHWVERFFPKRFSSKRVVINGFNMQPHPTVSAALSMPARTTTKHRGPDQPPSFGANIFVRLFGFSSSGQGGFFHQSSAHPSGLGATSFGFPRSLIEFGGFFIDQF